MMTILDFTKKKQARDKIVMLTCYDATTARLLDTTTVDCLLVGDSLAMTVHGFDHTLQATVEMMALHTAAVARGAKDKFIVADLPFLSYRRGLAAAVDAAGALMCAGACAVKLEGAAGNAETIAHLVASGIPVMGHIGLTPQGVHQLGGYRVQGKGEEGARRLLAEAAVLESAGCFSLVLECVPTPVATQITAQTGIATIGIGAGAATDGQVLVIQDLLGLNTAFKPRFVKRYADGAADLVAAVNAYAGEVRTGAFPDAAHSFA